MIRFDWEGMQGEIGALMKRYGELPRYIAKKHLKAVTKRVGKEGVKILKGNTPKGKPRLVAEGKVRGKVRTNYMARGGALRRAAMVKSKYKGTNRDGYVYGVLGYKFGEESRKAIWLEYGTKNGVKPQLMVYKTMQQWRGPAAQMMEKEMRLALEKATREAAAGINPGMSRRGRAAGLGPAG